MNDVAFHYVFGRTNTKGNLVNLLNAIFLKSHKEIIQDLTLKESELDPETIGLKSCRLDIRAVTASGSHINVEVQINNQYDMEKRSLFYWSKLYLSQLRKGDTYQELAKTITVNLMDFSYLNNDKVLSTYQLLEIQDHLLLTDVLEIHFIELPKLWNSGIDIFCPLTRWLLFLNENTDQKLLEEILVKDQNIHRAYDDLNKLIVDESSLRMYELREKALLDERSNLHGARQEGIAIGIKKGREEGREEGMDLERKQIAKNMLEKALDENLIMELVGVTPEQLHALKQSLV